MILDDLLKIRDGGSSPAVTATEAGSTSLTRDATTGKAVIDVSKMPGDGLPVILITGADGGTSTDKTLVVTIEGSDDLSNWYLVAAFPTVTHGDAAAKYVRNIATQRKYIRSVITAAGSNGTISIDHKIYVGTGELDR